LSGALGVLAAALAAWIIWVQWPQPPTLDGERWFKVALATALRGVVDGSGGDVGAWEAALARWVPYHPAGRAPERKVSNPVVAVLPGAALPGEVALVEALAQLREPSARWARLYDDPAAREVLLADPADLGSDYALDWDGLAAWAAGGAGPDLARVGARWVLLEGRLDRLVGPSLLPALAAVLADPVRIPFDPEGLGSELRALLVGADVRLVLVGEEAAVAALLRVLVDAGDVRDQVVAVVSLGGVIGGRTDEAGPFGGQACADWLHARFTQRDLDTDVVRFTPYFSLQWLDQSHWPPGVPGLPLQASRFPEPSAEGATAVTIEAVDLGPLPAHAEAPLGAIARALVAVVSAWVVKRR